MSNRFDEVEAKSTVQNLSGIRPKGHAVLCLPYEPPKGDSKIIIPDTVRERAKMQRDKLQVIACGDACWSDEKRPRAQIGDLVLVPYLAGRMVTGKDSLVYRIVNDRDVFAEVDPEAAE